LTPLARSYAHAFLDVAPKDYDVDRALEGLRAVEDAVVGDPQLKAFLQAPNVPAKAKENALAAVAKKAGVDDFGARLLQVVLRHRRIAQLPEILGGVSEAADSRRGVVAAKVTVASPIGEAEREKIEAALSRRVGRRLRMRVDVDANVLGGFVAKVGSEVFDASVTRAIERFRAGAKETSGS
jgi:F-type H+-transporting ATPase subunit delta